MNIQEARKLFEEYVKDEKIKLHCIEVEAIMKFLAREFNENEEKYAVTGLLHDLDYKNTEIEEHGKKTIEILKGKVDDEVIHAILSHNEENTGIKRESKLDYALSAADNVSGLIVAYGLMRKSLEGMDVKGLKKKMKSKDFAATVRRDLIYEIEKFMPLDKFLDIAIKAMQNIAKEIGF